MVAVTVARTPRTRQNGRETGLRYLMRATRPVVSPDEEACGSAGELWLN